MSYLVLARKWRPTNFEQVVGQDGVVRTLKNAIQMDRVAHAYLFCGARGVGKTTVARILAKALNCEKGPTPTPDNTCTSCSEIARGGSPDVLEIDGASNTGVDDVRSLRENSAYLPARSRFKIYIIDEVHMLSTSAFNALLKTLEEPPAHVKFIFATTEPHKIPLTILSRCQRFDFKRIPSATILEHLKHLLLQEGAEIEEEGIRLIAREAAGSLRDSLSLLDQVLAFGGERVNAQQVREALGLTSSTVFEEVTNAIVDRRPDELVRITEELFEEGHDLKRFLDGLLWHVHHLILFASLREPGELLDLLPEERTRLCDLSRRADPLRWQQVFEVLARALEDLGRNPYPRLVVETALLRLSAIEPVVAVADLLQRMEDLARRIGVEGSGTDRSSPVGGAGRPRPAPPPSSATSPRPTDPGVPPGRAPAAGKPEHPREGSPGESGLPKGWGELVEFVSKRRPSLGSVLCNACPREVSGSCLRISLEKGSFFADQMKSSRNRQDLERFCQEFFGQKADLVIEEGTAAEGMSLARSQEIEEETARDKLRDQALSHPMVQEAIRVFGAEVDAVQSVSRRES